MRLITVLALAVTATAMPASLLGQLSAATMADELCALPTPGNNCAGAVLKDVIIQFGKASSEQKELIRNVAKSSGSNIVFDYKDFGFSGFVPEPVIDIIQEHGKQFELQVHENACSEIPWCGEAPC